MHTAICSGGERPVRGARGWPEKSNAICRYGFVEANYRLAELPEITRGAASIERVRALLALPPMIRRAEYVPNDHLKVNAGYYSIVAGQDGWSGSQKRRTGTLSDVTCRKGAFIIDAALS